VSGLPVHPDLADLGEEALTSWLKEAISSGKGRIANGYQGSVYFYNSGSHRLIIKHAKGVLFKWLRQAMIRREHRIYQRLEGLRGIPRCYGLLHGQYLLLEHIDAPNVRHILLKDREAFLDKLLKLILAMHERDVVHGDLKRKDNILVLNREEPYLVDFAMAIARKSRLRLLNRFMYGLWERLDFNAWLKLKYGREFAGMSEQDRVYYRPTFIEGVSRKIGKPLHSLKRVWRRAKARVV
jgi:predicted Ser/Thr protein kinase